MTASLSSRASSGNVTPRSCGIALHNCSTFSCTSANSSACSNGVTKTGNVTIQRFAGTVLRAKSRSYQEVQYDYVTYHSTEAVFRDCLPHCA
jgi:hypothetical protein